MPLVGMTKLVILKMYSQKPLSAQNTQELTLGNMNLDVLLENFFTTKSNVAKLARKRMFVCVLPPMYLENVFRPKCFKANIA